MKFLRAIQLDGSDRHVYHHAATPGEWAVPGSFALWDGEPDAADGKARQAFLHGFVGTESFGHTTLVATAEIAAEELKQAKTRIAQHLIERYGAPSPEQAQSIAEEEVRFAMELCEHPVGTLIAVERNVGPDGIEEQFRVVKPDAGDHEQVKIWGWAED